MAPTMAWHGMALESTTGETMLPLIDAEVVGGRGRNTTDAVRGVV